MPEPLRILIPAALGRGSCALDKPHPRSAGPQHSRSLRPSIDLSPRRQEHKEKPAKKTRYDIETCCPGWGGRDNAPGMADGLSERYADLLTGSYDCVDRIVLNAYFRMGHDPGGFRIWWRALTGSDEGLANTHLMRMAGRFSRRIRGYAKANGIPVVDCPVGERKHDLAEEYRAKTKDTQGLFLILVGRAQAPVWDVSVNHHIERKKPMPYVNHYSFHILDSEWGHITIKISGHPPFPDRKSV